MHVYFILPSNWTIAQKILQSVESIRIITRKSKSLKLWYSLRALFLPCEHFIGMQKPSILSNAPENYHIISVLKIALEILFLLPELLTHLCYNLVTISLQPSHWWYYVWLTIHNLSFQQSCCNNHPCCSINHISNLSRARSLRSDLRSETKNSFFESGH